MDFESARSHLLKKIKSVEPSGFDKLALEVFRFQAQWNPLYRHYLQLLKVNPGSLSSLDAVPFLPISFFKTASIKTGSWESQYEFNSSGTTGATTSRHYLRDLDFYRQITRMGFETFYGNLSDYAILALLPSYLERKNSSLVYMADFFIRESRYSQSAFFLYNNAELVEVIADCQKQQIPMLLLGVSFALWDLAEEFQLAPDGLTVMETGGMKGRRAEIIRTELHAILKRSFGVEAIHSEYGMTELLSQGYSQGGGLFHPSPTLRVRCREITDPFEQQAFGKTGALNIIDLANLDTVSFIATDDLGKVYEDHSFEVLGRLDNSDLRGCNLLVY